MRRLFIALVLLGVISLAQAQCDCVPDKKLSKLISQSEDKKNDLKERMAKLEEAMEMDDDCMEARFRLAKLSYKRSRRSKGLNSSTSEEYFRTINNRCPDFHPERYKPQWYYSDQYFQPV